MADIESKIAEKHTPLPWRACNDGKCSCKQIWCPDYPIAVVNSGDWGDDYPSVRLIGESSLDLKAEAYMEQCTYGHIPEEVAEANIQYIIQACNEYEGLKNKLALIAADRAGLVEALEAGKDEIWRLRHASNERPERTLNVIKQMISALKGGQ